MAFAVNDVVYINTTVADGHPAIDGSRYGRVIKLNPNGQVATYLVDPANNRIGNFIFNEVNLTAVTGAAVYNPNLPPAV